MITHVVPLFAPVIDGVGDYALNLARQLRVRFGMESRFVVCDANWPNEGAVDGFPVAGPSGFDRERIASMLSEADTILLHYVGYAYDTSGRPKWLIEALNQWLAGADGRNLTTVFHEIWSSGPPWRKVFYAAPEQKRIAHRLLKLSSRAFVSTVGAEEALNQLASGRVTRLPIPGGIDCAEPKFSRKREGPPWRPILFGQTWTRLPAIRKHRALIESLQARNELDCMMVMGKDARDGARASADVLALREILPPEKIRAVGEVSGPAGAEAFANADFYLSLHPAREACKSSALMAAFACGCPAVVPSGADPAPLVEGKHFLACDGSAASLERFRAQSSRLGAIGREARAWYVENADWSVVSEAIGRALAEIQAPPAPARL